MADVVELPRRRQVRRDRLNNSSGLIWWDGRTWRWERIGEDAQGDEVHLEDELPALAYLDPTNPHAEDVALEQAGFKAVRDRGFDIPVGSRWLIKRPAPSGVAPLVALQRAA